MFSSWFVSRSHTGSTLRLYTEWFPEAMAALGLGLKGGHRDPPSAWGCPVLGPFWATGWKPTCGVSRAKAKNPRSGEKTRHLGALAMPRSRKRPNQDTLVRRLRPSSQSNSKQPSTQKHWGWEREGRETSGHTGILELGRPWEQLQASQVPRHVLGGPVHGPAACTARRGRRTNAPQQKNGPSDTCLSCAHCSFCL